MDGITIEWAPNPLFTKVILDERAKTEFKLRLIIDHVWMDLFSAYFSLNKEKWPKHYDPERALQQLKPVFETDAQTDAENIEALAKDAGYEWYLEELTNAHCGDCTCVPASCPKCAAERVLGLDTIKGLGKHEASKIFGAFGGWENNRTLDEAIAYLESYKPVRGEAWLKYPQEDFDRHVQRWTEENKRALAWLKQYRDDHFKGE